MKSLSPGGASAAGPNAMVQTSCNSLTFGAVAWQTLTKHHYLLHALRTLPSYRITNVTKHTATRSCPHQAGAGFLARG